MISPKLEEEFEIGWNTISENLHVFGRTNTLTKKQLNFSRKLVLMDEKEFSRKTFHIFFRRPKKTQTILLKNRLNSYL